jgi:hypothetical protein
VRLNHVLSNGVGFAELGIKDPLLLPQLRPKDRKLLPKWLFDDSTFSVFRSHVVCGGLLSRGDIIGVGHVAAGGDGGRILHLVGLAARS